MPKLVYVEASPRKERSHSIRVAQAFLETYRETHPDDEVETLDLWNLRLRSSTAPWSTQSTGSCTVKNTRPKRRRPGAP